MTRFASLEQLAALLYGFIAVHLVHVLHLGGRHVERRRHLGPGPPSVGRRAAASRDERNRAEGGGERGPEAPCAGVTAAFCPLVGAVVQGSLHRWSSKVPDLVTGMLSLSRQSVSCRRTI